MMDLSSKQIKETTMTQNVTLKRIYRILFGYIGNTTTAAADRNLLEAIENFKAISEVGLDKYELMNMVQQSTLLLPWVACMTSCRMFATF